MAGIARKGDRHEGICGHGLPCCPHKVYGKIITGSESASDGSNGIARLYDKVTHNCPHCGTGYISKGSSSVITNGLPTARVGDEVTYPGGKGKIVKGNDNTIVGG